MVGVGTNIILLSPSPLQTFVNAVVNFYVYSNYYMCFSKTF